jgi:hypothetical protein
MEITVAAAHNLVVHIPWKHLQTESLRVEVESLELSLVEPDEELQLEPLPSVFASSRKAAPKKSAASAPKKKDKRTWIDSVVENVALRVGALRFSVQPRARIPASGGDPVLPAALAVRVDELAFSIADDKFQPVGHKDVPKVLARAKVNRVLTLRKLLTIASIHVGALRGADAVPLDSLKLPAVRAEVELKRHAVTGAVSSLAAAISTGLLRASFERADYLQFMASLEGLLWSMYRQTEDEVDGAAAAAAVAAPDASGTRTPKERRTSADNLLDDDTPEELLARLEAIEIVDDAETNGSGSDAPSRQQSQSSASAPQGELSLVSVSFAQAGIELTLTDSASRRGYSLSLRPIALQVTSEKTRASDNMRFVRSVAAKLTLGAFSSSDLRGVALIAQQLPSRRDGLGDVTYEYGFGTERTMLEGSEASSSAEEFDADESSSEQVKLAAFGAIEARRASDMEVPKPDLLSGKVSVRFIEGALFAEPLELSVSLRSSPLRLFLERGLLADLVDFVASGVPAMPPAKETIVTDFTLVRPSRLALSVHLGVVTVYVPAPLGVPLTHDVRAVLGPLSLKSPAVPGEALELRGAFELGVFLVPVPSGGRTDSDSLRQPAHQASGFAREGEVTVLQPTAIQIAVEVRNFVRTIELLVNAAPKQLELMPLTQLVEVSVRAGLHVDLSDAILASLVQGWMPVLKIIDDSKEARNRRTARQRRREERRIKLLAEHNDDVLRRSTRLVPGKKKKGAAATTATTPAPAPMSASASRKPNPAADGVSPGMAALANGRVPWRLRARLVPQSDDAALLQLRGRTGAPFSLLDIFEDWSLEKWTQSAATSSLLRLRPTAVHVDLQHTALGALNARVQLESLRLDLQQPLMVCPLGIHIQPGVERQHGKDIKRVAVESDGDSGGGEALPTSASSEALNDETQLTGLQIAYDFHVPQGAHDYPHEAHLRLLGTHIRITEHGPLGIKPLKHMIKVFYWRVIRGLELAPKPVEITTFPLWLHVDAQLGDCSLELVRNGELPAVITRDVFQLVVHSADRLLMRARTEALERRARRAIKQANAADERTAAAAAETLDANVTLAAVKMQLFELQAEHDAQQKTTRDAVRAAERAQSEAAAVATTYREVMALLNVEQGGAEAAITVQRLASEKIQLRSELDASEQERARLARQVEQLQEQISRLTGHVSLPPPVASSSSSSSAPAPAKTPPSNKRVQQAVPPSPAKNAVASSSSSSSPSSTSSPDTATKSRSGRVMDKVRAKLTSSVPAPLPAGSTVVVEARPQGKDVLLAAPVTMQVGADITVTYAFGSFESNTWDWFGLYSRNEIDPKKYVAFQWKKGAAGRAVFKATHVGMFEVRVFRGQSKKQYYSPVAISNFVQVLHAAE